MAFVLLGALGGGAVGGLGGWIFGGTAGAAIGGLAGAAVGGLTGAAVEYRRYYPPYAHAYVYYPHARYVHYPPYSYAPQNYHPYPPYGLPYPTNYCYRRRPLHVPMRYVPVPVMAYW